MVILKNINFNFLFKNKFDIFLFLISFFIKFFIFSNFKKKYFIKLFEYFKNFINKTIIKKSRIIVIFYSLLMFLNILFQNIIDLFPNNLIKTFFKYMIVPTSDINITFALSFISFFFINFISIKNIGIKKFFLCFLIYPIKKKYMFIFNFIIESITFIMKPISLSLRLFGNIFSSEIIFDLISKMNFSENCILNIIWGTFHYLVLPLQSFIFITLVIIYISQNLKH